MVRPKELKSPVTICAKIERYHFIQLTQDGEYELSSALRAVLAHHYGEPKNEDESV